MVEGSALGISHSWIEAGQVSTQDSSYGKLIGHLDRPADA